MGSLFVEFLGEEHEIFDGSSITFGRDARIVVDSANLHLHRVLGVFVQLDSLWVLQNVGRFITMVVADAHSRTELAPGGQLPLLSEEFVVDFSAGRAHYELTGALSEAAPLSLSAPNPTDTIDQAVWALNRDQRLLLTALAAPLLRGDPSWPSTMPSNSDVARSLGWSLTKFNRKLDYLCSRLDKSGVSGLRGDAGRHASGRRVRLVEYFMKLGTISRADLDLLESVQEAVDQP